MEVAAACAGTDYDTYSESEATMAKIQQLMSQGQARKPSDLPPVDG